MPMAAREIEALIQRHLPDAQVRIEDLRGDGDHYLAHVSAAAFRGKTRVQQHQMVYAALGDRMKDDIHALSMRTMTPEDRTAETTVDQST